MNGYIIVGIVVVVLAFLLILIRLGRKNKGNSQSYSQSYSQPSQSSGLLSRANQSLKDLACCLKRGGGA